MIRNSGEEYHDHRVSEDPADRETLRRLITAMGSPVRALLREKALRRLRLMIRP